MEGTISAKAAKLKIYLKLLIFLTHEPFFDISALTKLILSL